MSGYPKVHLFYATDDEDVPVSDSARLHGMLDGRTGYTEVTVGTGGHGFLLMPAYLPDTLTAVSRLLYGADFQPKHLGAAGAGRGNAHAAGM